MRYLVKGDSGIPCLDPTEEQIAVRRRARRCFVRRAIALLCVMLAGFFAIQLFKNGGLSDSSMAASAPEWDSPSSVLAWLRSNLSSVRWQVRNEIKGAVPFGNLAIILKLAFCSVAAAVFLRVPSRS